MNIFTQTCTTNIISGILEKTTCVIDATYLYWFLGVIIMLLIFIWLKR